MTEDDPLVAAFPWADHMPPDERQRCVRELLNVVAAADGGAAAFGSVRQVITAWKHTAEVYADPEALQALTGPADDFGPVAEPMA